MRRKLHPRRTGLAVYTGGGNRRERNRRLSLLRLIALLSGLVILFVVMDSQFRPLIKSYGMTQAKLVATQVVNEAVARVLQGENLKYADLVKVDKDDAGDIISIESDVLKINSLKAEVTTAITDELKNSDRMTVYIPLGTLLNWELFTGRGPKIPVHISINGAALTTMSSQFQSAGINQTNHQIMMSIQVLLYAAIPGYDSSTTVDTDFMIAETVLVGKVPDSFTDVDGDKSDIVGKIFDYTKNR